MKETINTDGEPREEEFPNGRPYSQRLLQRNLLCTKTWAKRRRILGGEGVPAVITHLMRMRGFQGRWAGNPRACGHQPLPGGPLGWGPLPEPVLKAAEHTHAVPSAQPPLAFQDAMFSAERPLRGPLGNGWRQQGMWGGGIKDALGDVGMGRAG